MRAKLLTVVLDDRAQALVEYALVVLLYVGLALVLVAVFSRSLFAGIGDHATRAMLTELPANGTLGEGVSDVLDLLSF